MKQPVTTVTYIPRNTESRLQHFSDGYPVVVVTGPRQSGKSTFVRHAFPEHRYVSLEDLDQREFAETDPRGFLNQFSGGAILDEAQRCPALFSYLQTRVDERQRPGEFILTGSQQFGLLSGITQSLAGRAALLTLLPMSYDELQRAGKINKNLDRILFDGAYPPIHDRGLEPHPWYGNYVRTYLERDVRELINVRDLGTFQRFLKLCAGRTGQLLNLSSLANDCGITHNTAKAWISVLEASYIVHLLPPHHQDFNKRLVKTPKLYFLDTGLASWLLGIQNSEQLATHVQRGALFETWVISELLKARYNAGETSNLYFWRDRSGHEVDLLIDQGTHLSPLEIKSGQTINRDYFKGLDFWRKLAG
ncbi:MAG TPA: ATP-binding protein, partial [Gammaproteobacteria bacterium]|nr:ATP-binding protein [Gammaproteobacteria bacterium]